MKAIVFETTGGPEVLALADAPKPEAHRFLESRQSTGKLVLMPA